jgi:hypothetical protein
MHKGAEGEEALHYWNLAASAKRTPRYTRRERHYLCVSVACFALLIIDPVQIETEKAGGHLEQKTSATRSYRRMW